MFMTYLFKHLWVCSGSQEMKNLRCKYILRQLNNVKKKKFPVSMPNHPGGYSKRGSVGVCTRARITVLTSLWVNLEGEFIV